MSVRYLQSGDDSTAKLLSGGQIDDDGQAWWGGAQRCFASVAIAAAIAVTTLATNVAQATQQDPEEIPAGSLKKFTSPDEDYWSPCANATGDGQTAPAQWTLYQPLPYLPDLSDDPAHTLLKFNSPDEDCWVQESVAFTPQLWPSNFLDLPYDPDPEELPAGSLYGSKPDEDYWRNPVAPVTGSNYQPLPYLPDLSDDPAHTLLKFNSPDEDYWLQPEIAQIAQIWPSNQPPLPYASGEPAEIHISALYIEEEYWLNPVAPLAGAFRFPLPYLPDPSDEPAQFHWIELDWYAPSNATSTVGYNIYRGTSGPGSEGSTPINASPVDVGASPSSLCTYNDCNIQWGQTYWYVVYAYDSSTGLQSSSPTNEISASYPPVLDEDYWQQPQVAQIAQILPLPYTAGEAAEIIPSVTFQPDEDYWPPFANASGGWQQPQIVQPGLPYLPDPTDTYEPWWWLKNDQCGSGTGATVSAAAFSSALTNGSTIIVCVMAQDLNVHTPTDTAGNTYVDCGAGVVPFNSGTCGIEIFWAHNAQTTSSNVISIPNPGNVLCCLEASEWQYHSAGTSNIIVWVDTPNGSTGTGGGWNISLGATRPSGYSYPLWLGFACAANGTVAPNGATWTALSSPSSTFRAEWLFVYSGSSTQTAQWNDSQNNDSYAAITLALYYSTIGLDEFYWNNPVAPIPATLFEPLPYLPDPEELLAGSLAKFSTPDEDYYPPYAPGASGGWQPPQIAQMAQILPLPYAAGEAGEITPSVTYQPDEDYWQNFVGAVREPPLRLQFPHLPDLSDDPSGSLKKFVSPDEDYWPPFAGAAGGIAPVPASLYQPLPIAAGETAEIVPSITFHPDEDYWQNFVGAVREPPLRLQFPYLPDFSDEPAASLHGQPDEDYWQNRAAPVAATIFQPLPYASGEAAEIPPPVRLTADEDCWPPLAIAAGGWQNPIIPTLAAQGWVQPVTCGFDDFSSYWWLSTWGVCTHSAARGRVSHSAARERISRSAVRPRTSRGVSRQSTW